MLMLTFTASLPQLRPPSCSTPSEKPNDCPPPSGFKLSFFYLSMSLLVVGAGGILPCTLPFGVDQFDRNTEHGRRALTSFFNWFYFTAAFTLFFAITVMSYVQNSISWPIGFGIPTFLMLLAIVLFFLGSRMYVLVAPEGSIFSGIPQVFVAALRKRRLRLPHSSLLYNPPQRSSQFITKLPCTQKFPYLNKAAIELPGEVNAENSNRTKPWRLCSVQQIEEVKCLLRIVPIWVSGILLYVAFTQQWTFTVLQSLKMERRLGHFSIPPGSVGAFFLLGLAQCVPVYDRIFVPSVRRFTKLEQGITMLQRQGTGPVISVPAMMVEAVIERKKRNELVDGGGTAAMSVMWFPPQLMLMGITDAFNLVGQIKFYNKEFPEQMQSIVGLLIFLTFGFSSYLSSFFVSLARKVNWWGGKDELGGR
ncbi:hypothetical protein HPP92_007935 [Vanilla planifolia]|uniref:Uncharacterized protein n=1 Tax=Vanilla planifolia TaxID=51239 RepID=A0A835RDI7_VANPL|nr:hypothetical protein HPP92_007935 [Vanilla planifolia]